MKFRTEIDVGPSTVRIGYANRILCLGSCFADEMGARLSEAKFRSATNPTGVLFNPESVADALLRAASGLLPRREELSRSADGVWFHYGFHGAFSDPDPDAALLRMNQGMQRLARSFAEADRLLVTFGTAWTYQVRATGRTAANCHRQPRETFLRHRLSVASIVDRWSELLDSVLARKEVIFTVSPVRHAGDGAVENSLSKALLRVAVAELVEKHPNATYFPAFELLTDDLRDYRFYADDMMHPSARAVDYIWEKFAAAHLDQQARSLLPRVAELVAAARHRPHHPSNEAYRAFARRMTERARLLEHETGADFTCEKAAFTAHGTE